MYMIQMRLLIMINAIENIKREHINSQFVSKHTPQQFLSLTHSLLNPLFIAFYIRQSRSRINPHFQDWAHKTRSLKNK